VENKMGNTLEMRVLDLKELSINKNNKKFEPTPIPMTCSCDPISAEDVETGRGL
jgi:hypothetical protein